MKQVNSLENQLGQKLMGRAQEGIRQIVYIMTLFMMDYSEKAIQKEKETMNPKDKVFHVNPFSLYPAKPFMVVWHRTCRDFLDYKLFLVSFGDNHGETLSVISKIGTRFDFPFGDCDAKPWFGRYGMLQPGRFRKMIAASRRLESLHTLRILYPQKPSADVIRFLDDVTNSETKRQHISDIMGKRSFP